MLFYWIDQINANSDNNLTDKNKDLKIIKEFKSID